MHWCRKRIKRSKIRHFALDRDVISVEHAIRSMTSLPATIMGLRDRGAVREGHHADIVVFDMDEIRDEATFFEPHQHASGIEYVIVNGDFVVGVADLLIMLAAWGPCGPGSCPADLDDDGGVAFGDLLLLLAAWSPSV